MEETENGSSDVEDFARAVESAIEASLEAGEDALASLLVAARSVGLFLGPDAVRGAEERARACFESESPDTFRGIASELFERHGKRVTITDHALDGYTEAALLALKLLSPRSAFELITIFHIAERTVTNVVEDQLGKAVMRDFIAQVADMKRFLSAVKFEGDLIVASTMTKGGVS